MLTTCIGEFVNRLERVDGSHWWRLTKRTFAHEITQFLIFRFDIVRIRCADQMPFNRLQQNCANQHMQRNGANDHHTAVHIIID